MTFRKGVSGTRFQILLELVCALVFPETDGNVDLPRAELGGVGAASLVVLIEPGREIGRAANIPLIWMRQTLLRR